jgi:hypothetical protein
MMTEAYVVSITTEILVMGERAQTPWAVIANTPE